MVVDQSTTSSCVVRRSDAVESGVRPLSGFYLWVAPRGRERSFAALATVSNHTRRPAHAAVGLNLTVAARDDAFLEPAEVVAFESGLATQVRLLPGEPLAQVRVLLTNISRLRNLAGGRRRARYVPD